MTNPSTSQHACLTDRAGLWVGDTRGESKSSALHLQLFRGEDITQQQVALNKDKTACGRLCTMQFMTEREMMGAGNRQEEVPQCLYGRGVERGTRLTWFKAALSDTHTAFLCCILGRVNGEEGAAHTPREAVVWCC